ncbi:Hypothetical protein FKW44_012178 [Caligus rogercresseyi]|uniref:Uncharacterized protein n=1 Tax=Caligus rogercresseyi TaxID=217165 RepID=A0A7T8HJ09_CALRO|nr:Hypothetical protein FKW44_012178 [Caligus rogercresseyi]
MSAPGPSVPQESPRDRAWDKFFAEAGELYQFPDDNGTLHVGLSSTSDMALADEKRVVFLSTYFDQ